jgi:hypothetical protein
MVLLAANNAAGNEQTLDPAENNAGNEPILLAQNVALKEENISNAAVNVDGKGVILKGYDTVAYFKTRAGSQREFCNREYPSRRQILFRLSS